MDPTGYLEGLQLSARQTKPSHRVSDLGDLRPFDHFKFLTTNSKHQKHVFPEMLQYTFLALQSFIMQLDFLHAFVQPKPVPFLYQKFCEGGESAEKKGRSAAGESGVSRRWTSFYELKMMGQHPLLFT